MAVKVTESGRVQGSLNENKETSGAERPLIVTVAEKVGDRTLNWA